MDNKKDPDEPFFCGKCGGVYFFIPVSAESIAKMHCEVSQDGSYYTITGYTGDFKIVENVTVCTKCKAEYQLGSLRLLR